MKNNPLLLTLKSDIFKFTFCKLGIFMYGYPIPQYSSTNTQTPVYSPPSTALIKYNVVLIPKKIDQIYSTPAIYANAKANVTGDCYFTSTSLVFIPRTNKKAWTLEINWKDISLIEKIQKRAMEKGIELTIGDQKVAFTQMSNRDAFWNYVLLLSKTSKNSQPTFGFTKRDETEVVHKLTILRAPCAFETILETDMKNLFSVLKKAEVFEESLQVVGCTDIVTSSWHKTKDGIVREIHYVQPLFHSTNVVMTQTLMKSGQTAALEFLIRLSRPTQSDFLHVPMQFFFRKVDGKLSFRCAYSLDWIKDVWDLEFVEAAVARSIRVLFHYITSKINKTTFNESEFEGQWRRHQPFVLMIVALIGLIIGTILTPDPRYWYKFLAGIIALMLFFAL